MASLHTPQSRWLRSLLLVLFVNPSIGHALSSHAADDSMACSSAGSEVCGEMYDDDDAEGASLSLLQKAAAKLQRPRAAHVKLAAATVSQQMQASKELAAHWEDLKKPPHKVYQHGFSIPTRPTARTLVWIAIAVPCCMVVVFAGLSFLAGKIWRTPSASERGNNLPRVTRVDGNGMPLHINWHFVSWSSIAIAMANVNYVVVLPAAVENFGGSLWEAGIWVGLYAGGALLALPYFVSLGHHSPRTALVAHAVFTLVGNVVMVWAAAEQYLGWLYVGRIITGFAGSYKYSCDHGCLHVIPTWDRLEAIFITRMAYAVGFALGPCISPICDSIITAWPWLLHAFPTYNAAAEAVPLIVMSIYGLVFLFCSLFIFPGLEILDAESEGVSDISLEAMHAGNASPERKMAAIKMFTSTNVTNFTRIFIRVAWEAGAMVTLVRQYMIGTMSGVVLSIVAITLVVSRGAMTKLSIAVGGDNSKLMRIFEWTGIISCPFLFRIGPPTGLSLTLFLVGSIIFYNSNSAQSGVLLALGSEKAIPGHRYLNKKALNIYYFVTNILAYMFGPATSFICQQFSVGQNTTAVLVATVTLLQVIITYTTVRPKSGADSDAFESARSGLKPPAKTSDQIDANVKKS